MNVTKTGKKNLVAVLGLGNVEHDKSVSCLEQLFDQVPGRIPVYEGDEISITF